MATNSKVDDKKVNLRFRTVVRHTCTIELVSMNSARIGNGFPWCALRRSWLLMSYIISTEMSVNIPC